MKRKQIYMHEFPSDSDDVFFEVHLTLEENNQLRDLARVRQISVSELLRRRVLKSARNDKLGGELLQRASDSTDKIMEIYKARDESGTQPTIDKASTALVEMADAYEQLAEWYGRQGVDDDYTL
jgi:hypothetical protein